MFPALAIFNTTYVSINRKKGLNAPYYKGRMPYLSNCSCAQKFRTSVQLEESGNGKMAVNNTFLIKQ